MRLLGPLPLASREDVVCVVETTLYSHQLENSSGVFRWRKESERSCTVAQYRLEFRTAPLGADCEDKSRITVTIHEEMVDSDRNFYLKWRIDSTRHRDICEMIVEETEFDIKETIFVDQDRFTHFENVKL